MPKTTIIAIVLLIIVAGFASFFARPLPSMMMRPGVVDSAPNQKLPADATSPGDPAHVVGVKWIWEGSVVGGSVALPANPGVFSITLNADGSVTGTTDCNGFGGTYRIGSDGVIDFGAFESTLMYCEGSQEAEFTQMITSVNRYTYSDISLVLYPADSADSMAFSKAEY